MTVKLHDQESSILVTGASGFIGSKLAFELSQLQQKVIALSRSAVSNHSEWTSIKHFNVNLEFGPGLVEIFAGNKINTVVHCAGHSTSNDGSNLIVDLDYNIGILQNLLVLSSLYKVSNFVFISTQKIQNWTSVTNDSYTAGKYLCERIVDRYAQLTRKRFFSIRLPNVIGKDENSSRIFPHLCESIARGQPFELKSAPETMIQFIDIGSAIKELIKLILYDENCCDIYNINPIYSYTIEEIASKLIEIKEEISSSYEKKRYNTLEKIYVEILQYYINKQGG